MPHQLPLTDRGERSERSDLDSSRPALTTHFDGPPPRVTGPARRRSGGRRPSRRTRVIAVLAILALISGLAGPVAAGGVDSSTSASSSSTDDPTGWWLKVLLAMWQAAQQPSAASATPTPAAGSGGSAGGTSTSGATAPGNNGTTTQTSNQAGSQPKSAKTFIAPTPVASAAASNNPVALGTLGTHPETAAVESASGVKVAMLEFNWGADETAPGVFNAQYEAGMLARLRSLQAAGMRVTLALGLHFTPAWVSAQQNLHYVDQHGNVSSEIDMVFNQQARTLAQQYLAHLNSVIPFSQFWAVRITSGGDAEALYPSTGAYWAFDAAAQNGADLPASMPRNPFPGWHPGTTGLTTAQVQTWANWYISSLANAVNWQMAQLKSAGFAGFYQVLTPGTGAIPQVYNALTAANLPDSIIGAGAVWDRFYAALPNKVNVVAYVSSMADNSGSNNGCQSADRTVALTSSVVSTWSADRWISRIADQYGLRKGGENPGYTASPQFQSLYTNLTATGMEQLASNQASTCNFQVMYWAHDDQLWNGTLSLASLLSRAKPSNSLPALASN